MGRDGCGALTWEPGKLAEALKLEETEVEAYFTDGRRVSFLLERRLARILHGDVSPTQRSGYDITDSEGNKWDVRSVTKRGVYFSPSKNVGAKREFNRGDLLQKLKEIHGYYLVNVTKFPRMPYCPVTSDQVGEWWNEGKIGKEARIGLSKALELIPELGE